MEGHSCRSSSLCDLPDEVISHILSMLPMRDAVRFSILSKSLRYAWTSLPNLIIDERSFPARDQFLNFVKRALVIPYMFSLDRFSISCRTHCDMGLIHEWLVGAMRRNVRKFEMDLAQQEETSDEWTIVLPESLFTSEKLVEFCLQMNRQKPVLAIPPTTTCFSGLKALTLQGVIFQDDSITDKLFSGPALEKLTLTDCCFMGSEGVNIRAPNLRNLSMNQLDIVNNKILIHGSSLKTFSYADEIFYDCTVIGSPFLTEATFTLHQGLFSSIDNAHRLMRSLLNAERLTLSYLALIIMISLRMDEGLLMNRTLNNLSELAVWHSPTCIFVEGFAEILHLCPHLRTLEFQKGCEINVLDMRKEFFDPTPHCLLSSIKTITVSHCRCTEEELSAIGVLLGAAMVLEKMTIQISEIRLWSWSNWVFSILDLPRASKLCRVRFIES